MPVDGPSWRFGDNLSVVVSSNVPSSTLKKRMNLISYHRVREAIAAKVLWFCHVRSEENLADVLTKPLPNHLFYNLIKPILFRVPAHLRANDQSA